MLTSEEILTRLHAAIEAEGSIRAFARKYGLNAGYVSLILKGVHPVSDATAEALGYRRDFCFYPIQTPNTTTEETSEHE